MASGQVNRTNRPNTWLHRPSLRREDSSCQLGAVHTWHNVANAGGASDATQLWPSRAAPTGLRTPCLSGQWVQQIHLRNYRSRLLIQINCTIGGASDWVLLVECWPLPLVDNGAGRTTTAKGSKAKECKEPHSQRSCSFEQHAFKYFS
jgi:hypothetical protein